jgi:hypothetical protein
MPAFIKTPKDEKRWSKAKEAANKTHSEGDGDRYWGLVNHIYQNMNKAIDVALELGDDEALNKAIAMLEKARQKLSDEYDPNEAPEESDDLDEGFREFDPDEEDSSGEDWLKENDPKNAKGAEYDEYGDGEDEESHRKNIEDDESAVDEPESAGWPVDEERGIEAGAESDQHQEKAPQAQEEVAAAAPRSSRFKQPTPEEIKEMRAYTRPWEQRARETQKLNADPSKNPVLAHQGQVIEAREKSHGDRKGAYQQLINSDEYKKADPIQQMDMDDNFEKDWKSKNPEHLKQAFAQHHAAHEKGAQGHKVHEAAKDANIRNMLQGGSNPEESMSTEAALQNVGGVKGEEGTTGRIQQDPAASFANANQDFIKQYAQDYNKKAKKVGNIDEMQNYDDASRKDVARILGAAPGKDPKVEQFFSHYHPLIHMSASKTMKKLGLDPRSSDVDMSMLHEAGMHGLMQSINDYDHEHPSKASFSTHAGNKMRGLMQTALRDQDKVPGEVRRAQKQYMKTKAPAVKNLMSSHPKGQEMQQRHARIMSQKAAMPKKPEGQG